jgi:hypothetical protein
MAFGTQTFQKPPKFAKLKKLRDFINKHRLPFLIGAGVCVVFIGGFIAYIVIQQHPATGLATLVKPAPKPKPPVKYYSPLTGSEVADEATTKQAVTAIMIENSPDARPQSGLADAGVVYEAIAEGGITRFLTLHQEDKPQLIGPVRSVRLYYVEWAAPYNASIAHVGGSLFALNEVRNGNYRDIDQFFNSASYWRATDRYAPHNVYTSFEKLDALNASKGYTTSSFTGFPRQDGKASKAPNATSISLTISGPLYDSTYAYDASANNYKRSEGGEPHLDREKGQITADVVVALKVDMTLILEDGYREQITTTGSGVADIFENGTVQEVTWHKDSRAGQLYFTDASGKSVSLNRGKTWITAIPNGSGNVSWQ